MGVAANAIRRQWEGMHIISVKDQVSNSIGTVLKYKMGFVFNEELWLLPQWSLRTGRAVSLLCEVRSHLDLSIFVSLHSDFIRFRYVLFQIHPSRARVHGPGHGGRSERVL